MDASTSTCQRSEICCTGVLLSFHFSHCQLLARSTNSSRLDMYLALIQDAIHVSIRLRHLPIHTKLMNGNSSQKAENNDFIKNQKEIKKKTNQKIKKKTFKLKNQKQIKNKSKKKSKQKSKQKQEIIKKKSKNNQILGLADSCLGVPLGLFLGLFPGLVWGDPQNPKNAKNLER